MSRGPVLLTTINTSVDGATGFPLTHLLNNAFPTALMIVIIVSTIEIVKDVVQMLPLLKARLTKKS